MFTGLRKVVLTESQRQELIHLRDTSPLPYMRERCAAILKVADGKTALQVAVNGLLKPHKSDTVYEWLDRYQQEGVQGLKIKPGRGRKPAFFPSLHEQHSGSGPIA